MIPTDRFSRRAIAGRKDTPIFDVHRCILGKRKRLRCAGFGWIDDKGEQVLKVGKNQNADRTAQLIPEFDAGAESASALLIESVGQLQDLVNKESQQIEQEKGHGQVVLSVTEIVFNVIALVLKGICYLPE